MIALLSPKLWLTLIITVVLTFTHVFAYRSGKSIVRTAWDAETLTAEQAVRINEQNLQTAADKLRDQKNAEITRLTAARDAALYSLRHRPERPVADVPAIASVGTGCTGAELYRSDGEFLVGEAARADILRAALDQCQTQYTAARSALSGAP